MTESPDPTIHKRDIRRRRSLFGQTVTRLFGRTGAVAGAIWIGITALLAVFAPLLANSRPLAWKLNDPDGLGVGWRFPAFEMFTPQDVWFLAGFLLAVGCVACYRLGGKVFWVWLGVMCVVFAGSMVFYLLDAYDSLASEVTAARNEFAGNASKANAKGVRSALWDMGLWWVQWAIVAIIAAAFYALSIFKLFRSTACLIVTLALSVVIGGILLTPSLRITPPKIDAPTYASYRQYLAEGKAEQAWFALIPYSPNDNLPDKTTVDLDTLEIGVNNRYKPPGAHPVEDDIAGEMSKQAEDEYGIRLYDLTDEQGNEYPIPRSRDAARDASEKLWAAYQSAESYNPSLGQRKNRRVVAMLDAFDQLPGESRVHLMGTTGSGNDLASRMVHGSRIALYIGFISTGIAVFIGVIIGGVLGYFAGWVDLIGLRLVEIFSAIPVIMLLIMIVAFYGRSLVLMMVVIGLTGWVGYAYFVRAEFLKLRKMDYVMAARAAGTPLWLILFRHMLPNGVTPVLVGASFGIASGIMTEATLSFIGLGLEPTEPSWGQMLDEARQSGSFSWWLAIFPGMAIFLTVFAYNLIGEALRDVIDPRAVK